MFQLLQPVWLFAIAGIIIPVVIHLWNIREGKTLPVGSILLLKESARSPTGITRFKDILLLLLRCLLIITLAILLAKPTWQTPLATTRDKGWILIERQSLPAVYNNFKPTVDSLVKAGYKLHYFNAGFELVNLEDALKTAVDTNNQTAISYWTLLKELDNQVPSALPVYLFTDNRLKRFTGVRPAISLNLQWITYSPVDTLVKHIVKAYKTGTDSIHIVVANSKPEATFYTSEIIFNGTDNRYRLLNNKGKLLVSLKNEATDNGVEVDTSQLRIVIYTDRFITDANYLKAAIEAIGQYTGLPIKTYITSDTGDIKPASDWLFWLSEKALPVQKLPPKIFRYEKGNEQPVNSWILNGDFSALNTARIHLSTVIAHNGANNNNEPIWKDGFGHIVLSRSQNNNYTLHFYSHFDPAWNDLPWSEEFVRMISAY